MTRFHGLRTFGFFLFLAFRILLLQAQQNTDFLRPDPTARYHTFGRTYLFLVPNKVRRKVMVGLTGMKGPKNDSIELRMLQYLAPGRFDTEQSYKMKFYSGDEKELYDRCRRNETIGNCFIQNLYLDRLATVDDGKGQKGNGKTIRASLKFEKCIIANIIEPAGFGPKPVWDDAVGTGPNAKLLSLQANEKNNGNGALRPAADQAADQLVFEGEVSFDDCTLDAFTIDHGVFLKPVRLLNCVPKFVDNYDGNFNFAHCRFDSLTLKAFNYHKASLDYLMACNVPWTFDQSPRNDSVSINVPDSIAKLGIADMLRNLSHSVKRADSLLFTSYNFSHCELGGKNNGTTIVTNGDERNKINFANCAFTGKTILVPERYWSEASGSMDIQKEEEHNYGINLTDSRLTGSFDLGYFQKLIGCSMENTKFNNCGIYLHNTKTLKADGSGTDTGFWCRSLFSEDIAFEIGTHNLNTEKFPRISKFYLPFINFINKDQLLNNINDTASLAEYSEFVNGLKDVLASVFPSVSKPMVDKLTHDYQRVEAHFKLSHFSLANFFDACLYYFLETMVGNGYKGEWNFLIATLAAILAFASVYFFLFRKAALNYIAEHHGDGNAETDTNANAKNFCRCVWISCVLLISPQFPSSFFKITDRKLFALFISQWTLGILMVLLFLVFIASNYPVLTKLTGL